MRCFLLPVLSAARELKLLTSCFNSMQSPFIAKRQRAPSWNNRIWSKIQECWSLGFEARLENFVIHNVLYFYISERIIQRHSRILVLLVVSFWRKTSLHCFKTGRKLSKVFIWEFVCLNPQTGKNNLGRVWVAVGVILYILTLLTRLIAVICDIAKVWQGEEHKLSDGDGG